MAERAPSEPDVFLSYAREDEDRARELAQALEHGGFEVFWDREIPPGQTWHGYIGAALENARCVVVAWSSDSIRSQWVLEEAGEGNRRNALIPVLFDAVEQPLGFRAIQAANLVDWRPGRASPDFEALLNAIRRLVGAPPPGGAAQVVREEIPRPEAPRREGSAREEMPRPTPPEVTCRHATARAYRPWMLAGVVATVAIAGAMVYLWSVVTERVAQPTPVERSQREAQVEPAAPPEVAGTPVTTEDYQPGDEMRDCPECPEMVLVPAGDFTMGSPPGEEGRSDDRESPQRRVTIAAPFWVGKYEVTFAEWMPASQRVGAVTNQATTAGDVTVVR